MEIKIKKLHPEDQVQSLESVDCRTCIYCMKRSCWSSFKCIDGNQYENDRIIQLWEFSAMREQK